MKEKSIMENIDEGLSAARKEIADAEGVAREALREKEKSLSQVKGELEREKNLWQRLRDEFGVLEGEFEVEIRNRLEAVSVTESKVKIGEASLSEFQKTGKSESQIRAEVRAAASGRLEQARRIIREKSAEVYELAAQAAELEYQIAFLNFNAPHLYLERLKKETESIQRLLSNPGELVRVTSNANEAAKKDLLHAQNKHAFNICWDSLSVPEVKNLLFDARILPELLPQIEAFLATNPNPESAFRATFKCSIGKEGGSPEIYFSEAGAL